MDIDFETKLIECLDALENHEPIDQILARYPEDATRLRPMLATAGALPTLRMEPSEAVKAKSRGTFLSQARALRQTPPRRTGFVSRILTSFVAVALVCIVLGAGAVAASGSSLPGDPLYGLKRAVENVRLSVADTASRGALAAQFERTRIDETEALVEAGRSTKVEFVGTIKSMQSDTWLVDKVTVQVNPATRIEGEPAIGRRAQVEGITSPNGLQATSIKIETGNEPTPESTPKPTATTEPTSTPRPSNTPAPTATRTPVPAVPTSESTAVPTTAPTAEPTQVEMTGDVQSISAQAWIIDGQTIEINAQTEINGNIAVGQRVKVKANRTADGRMVAAQIELTGNSNGNNGNQNNNANSNNNGNSNDNANSNQNTNDNSNSNDNHNGNSNDNTNSNQNTNDNSNSNDNHNGNDG